jgi:hypothetical protein
VKENGMEKLLYDVEELRIEGYNGGLTFCDMSGRELMKISDLSHITLSDLQKLNCLGSIHFKACDDIFSAELDDSVVFHSVHTLQMEELEIDGELFSKVLRCFPALSKLTIEECENLELVPVEDGGLSDLRMLKSFNSLSCGRLLYRWHMGEVGGGSNAVKPFPTSLRDLDISFEKSMKSMGLLSNLTSLTSLELTSCEKLKMDGFNPLITVKLKKLIINTMYWDGEGISIAGDLLSEIARSKLMRAGSFQLKALYLDSISAVLTDPICSHLAPTLRKLRFYDPRTTNFIKADTTVLVGALFILDNHVKCIPIYLVPL